MALRRVFLYAAFAATFALTAGDALAAAGRGMSSGSRGSHSYSAPPSTNTAPRSAAPMERSVAPQQSFGQNSAAQRPAGGMFSGGFGRGLMGGLLGAGLIGMLFGNGLFGGLGGLMSMLGLIIQIGLVLLLVRFAIGFFRRRQPQMAGAGAQARSAPQAAFEANTPAGASFRQSAGGAMGGGASQPLTIEKNDFDAFEHRLGAIQSAYSAGNIGALRGLTTPEMASYFEQDLSDNQARGQVNRVSDVRLLQGDLSEAWREANDEYATVAMRFSMLDAMLDASTNAVLSGSLTQPRETTELWTFRRPRGSAANAWVLSAIQQAR